MPALRFGAPCLVFFLVSNLLGIFLLLIENLKLMQWFQIVQMLKQKVAWLEASNMDLRRELEEARDRIDALSQCALESQVSYVSFHHPFC